MFQGFDLSGRVAVVIGGTSGIGRAPARGLVQAGADSGSIPESAGGGVLLASPAASLVTDEIPVVDGGFLAGGVTP